MANRSTLRSLLNDEHDAIENYGSAIDHETDQSTAGLYSHIQGEEREHADELTQKLSQTEDNPMPKFMEAKLKKEYSDLPEDEQNHAVFGTMNKIGAMHGSEETPKGRAMQEKHEEDMEHEDQSSERPRFASGHPPMKKRKKFIGVD